MHLYYQTQLMLTILRLSFSGKIGYMNESINECQSCFEVLSFEFDIQHQTRTYEKSDFSSNTPAISHKLTNEHRFYQLLYIIIIQTINKQAHNSTYRPLFLLCFRINIEPFLPAYASYQRSQHYFHIQK